MASDPPERKYTYQRYAERIRGITTTAILEAARRYLDPDRLAIAVAGPVGTKR